MKLKHFSFFYSIFFFFCLSLLPLQLTSMAESVEPLRSDNFELIKDKDLYVCLDKKLSNIASVIDQVSLVDNDNNSPVNILKQYMEGGFLIGLRDEVLYVLEYADWLLDQQKNDALINDLRIKLNDLIENVLCDKLSIKKYEAMHGVRLKLLKAHSLSSDNNDACFRSSLSLPQVVGFETLFGNAASLYAAADTSATVVAGTTDRTNATSVVLASDTAATFGAGTTAFRGWTLNKNASTAELAFNYQNTDTVGQIAVPQYTLMQLDGLNNQVQFPAASTQLIFVGDTNLYRDSANVLKTDDSFVIGGLTSTGIVHNNASGLLSTSLIVNADVDAAAGIVDTKLATIATAGKVSNSATTATNLNTANAIVARNASGNFSTNMITLAGTTTSSTDVATKAYVDSVAASPGTNLNTANATVKRDSTGSFAAQTISLVDGVVSGNISLSDSTSATVGNVNKTGTRFIHNFGTNNVFVGKSAGNFTMTGTGQQVGVGVNALSTNTGGNQNTAIGYNALAVNTGGSDNTSVGAGSLSANTTGINNTAIGVASLALNTGGIWNTALGVSALGANTVGIYNTAVGVNSLAANTTGSYNTAVGVSSLAANTIGIQNTAVGVSSLVANTTGNDNTAAGANALAANTTGVQNTALGRSALAANTVGIQNTAVGASSLAANTTGSSSTAVGYSALALNTSGTQNTAVGHNSLAVNTIGIQNTAMGRSSLAANTTGNQNTAIGYNALLVNTTGVQNSVLGSAAGTALTTGTNNVFIGYNIAASTTTGSNNVYIDGNSLNPANESNTIRIGNTQTACYMQGISGQTSTSGVTVFVNASGKLGTTTSSRRFKHDIQPMKDASDALYNLNPVTFIYNDDETESIQYGLIAEEVEEVFPDLVAREEDGTPWTVRYALLPPLLLNEVQKHQKRLDDHDILVAKLNNLFLEQSELIAALKEDYESISRELNELCVAN